MIRHWFTNREANATPFERECDAKKFAELHANVVADYPDWEVVQWGERFHIQLRPGGPWVELQR